MCGHFEEGLPFLSLNPQTNPKGCNPNRGNLDQPLSLQTVHYKTPNCHIAPLMRVYIFGSLGTVVTYFMTHSGSFMCLLHKKKGKKCAVSIAMWGLSGSPVVTARAPMFFWELFFSLFFWKLLNCPPSAFLWPHSGEDQMPYPQVCQPDELV